MAKLRCHGSRSSATAANAGSLVDSCLSTVAATFLLRSKEKTKERMLVIPMLLISGNAFFKNPLAI